MRIGNETYDRLKFIMMHVIPAIIILVTGIGEIVGWPYAAQVAGIVGVVAEAIGVLIGVSSKAYYEELENED